ncbi:uncharacterized protein A1O5_09227 [Cladophialophora psammophila CBS 110553]|uniref:Transcription factor domain-containing protein n=1 Tax=Cladophialophora psammophila CBS 110553 TaxID=1182543 RepID=W9WSB9_9EURO|nr:uncharacterized protein A1O5_09227 [Cladophialophora psammophila CBS 110553]EXJ67880.1 hypothetical protein A1O5_09227 [Cladophialophora psammophila CBS 110553]
MEEQRPPLEEEVRRRTVDAALRRTLLDKTSEMCINATIELIDLLDLAYHTRNDTMPESWYTIFYLYNCGMTLLIHRHRRPDLDPGLKASWTKCLTILGHYQTMRRTAVKCVRLLELAARNFAPRHWLPSTTAGAGAGGRAAAMAQEQQQGQVQESNVMVGLGVGCSSSSSTASAVEARDQHQDKYRQQQLQMQQHCRQLSAAPGDVGVGSCGNLFAFQLDADLANATAQIPVPAQAQAQRQVDGDRDGNVECGAALPDLIFDDTIDFSWLSTAPFELSPEELTGTFW